MSFAKLLIWSSQLSLMILRQSTKFEYKEMCVYAKYRLSQRKDGGEEKQDRENKKQGKKKVEKPRLQRKRMPIKR